MLAAVDFKKFFQDQALKIVQDPRVMKVIQDPRVTKAMVQVFQVRGKVQETFDEQVESLAQSLNFATKSEVRELKRALKKMEHELERERKKAGEKHETSKKVKPESDGRS